MRALARVYIIVGHAGTGGACVSGLCEKHILPRLAEELSRQLVGLGHTVRVARYETHPGVTGNQYDQARADVRSFRPDVALELHVDSVGKGILIGYYKHCGKAKRLAESLYKTLSGSGLSMRPLVPVGLPQLETNWRRGISRRLMVHYDFPWAEGRWAAVLVENGSLADAGDRSYLKTRLSDLAYHYVRGIHAYLGLPVVPRKPPAGFPLLKPVLLIGAAVAIHPRWRRAVIQRLQRLRRWRA